MQLAVLSSLWMFWDVIAIFVYKLPQCGWYILFAAAFVAGTGVGFLKVTESCSQVIIWNFFCVIC